MRTCEPTDDTYEIVAENGIVVLRARRMPDTGERERTWKAAREMVMALGGESGDVKWEQEVQDYMVPLWLCMAFAGDNLYAAGPPCDVSEEDPLAGFEGRRGAKLEVIRADDGKRLADYELGHLPDYDGMMAARGRIYLITEDDHLLCLGEK